MRVLRRGAAARGPDPVRRLRRGRTRRGLDAMSAFRFIRLAEEAEIARLTLARPPLNILTIEMMLEISDALERLEARSSLKALVVAGEGKAFSAGVAIEDHVGDRVGPMLDTFHGIFRRLRRLDCLTLAAVNGAALGGGAEL